MLRQNVLLIMTALCSAMVCLTGVSRADELEETATYSLFQSPQAAFFIEQTENVLILDVRRDDQYNAAHIEDAIHIYLHDDDFISEIGRLDSTRPILVYDNISPPTEWTFPVLRNAGFEQIIYIRDGFSGWRRNGLPIETGTTVETFDFSAQGISRGR
ncbi:rhodanese-like domain-containing protein [Parvularcula sp. IMCC14364]|uniref:rhodanese-like domain-containing protein n=1 Tax=Parvularcula sp. IMCC14364 TaxID=3067902 RepID=UPI002740BF50|nr:rhodanese-like domain-containing protein [Parvularcula sp. IMCC14364]